MKLFGLFVINITLVILGIRYILKLYKSITAQNKVFDAFRKYASTSNSSTFKKKRVSTLLTRFFKA